ncbi:MAG: hypothetical protein IJ408_03625 [Clostridia bacterium]|nr:hypothetical protein [Clostridia bacterium]
MKKITTVLVIAFMLLSLCACEKKEQTPAAPQTQAPAVPVTELDSVTMGYGIVDGFFAKNSKELTERAEFIAIVTPTETYLESEYDGKVHRKCTVKKVLKGALTEESVITIYESANITENGIILLGGSPLMAKDLEYILFFNQTDTAGAYYIMHGGAFCLNTDINEKLKVENQKVYAGVMEDYREYFTGSDFRLIEDTESEFSTSLIHGAYYFPFSLEYENEKYTAFTDHYYPFEHYFDGTLKFTYGEKAADGKRIYLSSNDGYNGRMIYALCDGYLVPLLRDGTTFENAEIVGLRIYEKSNNDFCYEVPSKDVQKLVSKLKSGVFTPETTNDLFTDDAVLVEFYDEDGLYYHSVLFIEKGKLFGNTIGKDLTDTILSFMTEQNKVENLHIDDTYK